MIRRRVWVQGEVQGVGFRPRVQRLGEALGLSGFVRNGPHGVELELQGAPAGVEAFLAALSTLPPPIHVVGLRLEELEPVPLPPGFCIAPSRTEGATSPSIPPDLALCAACAREVRDPQDRRHDYAFTSCTDCGPRATIARRTPFDRESTSMEAFPLCPRCAAEYADPADRRFHAQTTACPDCGPRLCLRGSDGLPLPGPPLDRAAALLARGGLLGLKGVGGFQLLCDATDAAAVARVRLAKRRPDKPLAVMVVDLAAARALLGPELDLAPLEGPAGPIVVFPWDGRGLAPGIAQGELGLMLPTTALHLRLLDRLGRALVCTSANPAGLPLATALGPARAELGVAVDAWLDHDREILRPMDDSVLRVATGRRGPTVLRRARGLAPRALALASDGPTILAMGASLKCAPGLALGSWAHLAPHVGDLDGRRVLERFEAELDRLLADHGARPEALVGELHPDLPSTLIGRARAQALGLPFLQVPHHHAHVAAVLAEHRVTGPALGLAWDGVGLGLDGTAWGGEALVFAGGVLGGEGPQRVASLRPIPLVGGDRAARQPARVGLALLHALGLVEHPAAAPVLARARQALGAPTVDGALELLDRGLAPQSSAIGRLFDGVAFLLGGPGNTSFEAQAATWLEQQAGKGSPTALPPLSWQEGDPPRLDWGPLVEALLLAPVSLPDLARSFHAALIQAAVDLARRQGLADLVLSGGCFQNRLLREGLCDGLSRAGYRVWTADAVPCGDGGLALGQLQLARALLEHR